MQVPKTSSAAQPLPEIIQTFGGGMRDRDHPSMLDPNQYAYGKNIEVRDAGLAKTREGRVKVVDPLIGTPQGAVYYEYAASQGKIVMACSGKVYQWGGSGTTWTQIGTLQLDNVDQPVRFAITNSKLFMFSGGENVHSWNGTDAEMTDEGSGNTLPPKDSICITQNGRIIAAGDANNIDFVYFSDIFNGSSWNLTDNNVRIPTARGEAVTALATYRKQEILVFTSHSTHVLDVSAAATSGFIRNGIDPLVGCVAPMSVAVVGDDAFFLSADRQLRTIKRTINDNAFAVSMPVSYLVPNLFERISTSYAQLAAGVYYNNYYLLAAPLDASTVNSGVIAFDMLHQTTAPSGQIPICVGEWTNMYPLVWLVTNFNNRQKLHYIDSRDASVFEMFSGTSDDYDQITSQVDFRAPGWSAPNFDKTMHDAEFQFMDTIGTSTIYYAKDDSVFALLLSVTIGDSSAARLDTPGTILPFNLAVGGILKNLPLTFYRKGRSRYWQLRLIHTLGTMNLKQLTQRAWVEEPKTR